MMLETRGVSHTKDVIIEIPTSVLFAASLPTKQGFEIFSRRIFVSLAE